ncbi:uncharacterized protein LOC114262180 [Camellia sinensis]|uniref:uncharacterized protein LOC114262180 n=1 Tax=Camellia sinensis TaxID=4442 RepID=UPI0010367111|nr:uncharacterized protein LOC114262180 [Camellia sinensis]
MKIVTWNVTGLRRPKKRRSIKNFVVRERKIEVLLLQETKRSSIDDLFIKSLWPGEDVGFLEVGAEGSAGGLLCLWNPEVFELRECCSNKSFILMAGIINRTFEYVILNVYAPNDVIGRRLLRESLSKLKLAFTSPWCIDGDFNEIRFMSERKGYTRRDRGMMDFNDFIDLMELHDLPMVGRSFRKEKSEAD